MDKLMEKRHPVMLVGPPGSGKTVLINDKLSQLSEDYMVTRVPFNFYTTSGECDAVVMEGGGGAREEARPYREGGSGYPGNSVDRKDKPRRGHCLGDASVS